MNSTCMKYLGINGTIEELSKLGVDCTKRLMCTAFGAYPHLVLRISEESVDVDTEAFMAKEFYISQYGKLGRRKIGIHSVGISRLGDNRFRAILSRNGLRVPNNINTSRVEVTSMTGIDGAAYICIDFPEKRRTVVAPVVLTTQEENGWTDAERSAMADHLVTGEPVTVVEPAPVATPRNAPCVVVPANTVMDALSTQGYSFPMDTAISGSNIGGYFMYRGKTVIASFDSAEIYRALSSTGFRIPETVDLAVGE